jgi:hypothetical protein
MEEGGVCRRRKWDVEMAKRKKLEVEGEGEDACFREVVGELKPYFKLIRLHYPVRLAFSITMNKSQEQSLECVDVIIQRILCRNEVFED